MTNFKLSLLFYAELNYLIKNNIWNIFRSFQFIYCNCGLLFTVVFQNFLVGFIYRMNYFIILFIYFCFLYNHHYNF